MESKSAGHAGVLTGTTSHPGVSALVLTFNEEQNIANCLSCLGWVDEILVVDTGSTDRTVEIAKGFGAKILNHPKVMPLTAVRMFGYERTAGPWIIMMDADEMFGPALARELRRIAAEDSADAVYIPMLTYSLGARVRHGWLPYSYHPHFFKKGHFTSSPGTHQPHRIEGRKMHLPRRDDLSIWHFAHRDSSHFIEKLNVYTSTEARLFQEKEIRITPWVLIRKTLGTFIEHALRRRGVCGGVRGVALSLLMAFYRAAYLIKVWERRNGFGPDAPDPCAVAKAALLDEWKTP